MSSSGSAAASAAAVGGPCPFCGHALAPNQTQCPRCGHGSTATSDDIAELGRHERRRESRKRGTADLFFLLGLLLGGPLLSFDINPRLGLFLSLGGALASVARRYTSWSNLGSLAIGALLATVIGVSFFDPDSAVDVAGPDSVAQREMFASELASTLEDQGVRVEARGPDLITLWFYLPAVDARECGDYPPPSVRKHLAQIGFQRLVLISQNESRGPCSFRP